MKIAIIGAGASGITAAIAAKEAGAEPVLLERCERVGRKILATGNGRCNYTNFDGEEISHYHGENPYFASSIFSQFGVSDTVSFFEELGMLTKTEENQKAYPYSMQASAVLDVLRFRMEDLGIETITNFEVSQVKRKNGGFLITAYDKREVFADRVIIAAGGKASPALGSNGSGYDIAKGLGHSITKLFPALVQVKTDTTYVKALKGIKIDARVTYKSSKCKQQDEGEVLFCDYGLSGPAVFNISRACSEHEDGEISVDCLPGMDYATLRGLLEKRKSEKRSLENFFVGMLNKKLGMTIIKYAQIAPFSRSSASLSQKEINRLCESIKAFNFKVTGTTSWNNAQVTAGGIKTEEIDENTLMSKKCCGVYFCGEILDIDGDCGGFNLQWAWSSGYVAGKNAARDI